VAGRSTLVDHETPDEQPGSERPAMTSTQTWVVIGLLATFGMAMVGVVTQFVSSRIDQVLLRIELGETRTAARIDGLEQEVRGQLERLDHDVQAIATRVFRDES
jgi:hypothetical protein